MHEAELNIKVATFSSRKPMYPGQHTSSTPFKMRVVLIVMILISCYLTDTFAKKRSLKARVKRLEEARPVTTFVNWGRKSCTENSKVLYAGYGGKAAYSTTGNGVNYQCLPESPEWTKNEKPGLQHNSYIYGVEYWTNTLTHILETKDNHRGLPCTVCEVPNCSQFLMIPAKLKCPDTWTLQYTGTLMSERHGHTSSGEFVCVNKEHEFLAASSGDQVSGYVIPVEAVCGALPCPPYQNGFELSCVVCTK